MFLFHDLFAISPSQYATNGSAEQSTHTILVTQPEYNLPIALPASSPAIFFQFEHRIVFQPVHLNMSEHVSFLCYIHSSFPHPSVPSYPGSAEPSTDTFLVPWSPHNLLIALPVSPTHILFWFAQTITISPFYLYFWFQHVCICFIPMFLSFHPSVLP